jgi:hypothetical protein
LSRIILGSFFTGQKKYIFSGLQGKTCHPAVLKCESLILSRTMERRLNKSYRRLMKDISSARLDDFVLHQAYERHFSRLARMVLSFIRLMKDISHAWPDDFVFHHPYERHFQDLTGWFCPSSRL